MTVYEELLNDGVEKFDREIFPVLMNNKLIIKNSDFLHHSFPKTFKRLETQKVSVENKISLLRTHMDGGNNPGIFDSKILCDLTFVLAQTIFGYFQIFRSCLMCCLDFTKINVSLDNDPKFDETIRKLCEFKNSDGGLILHYDGLRKFFSMDVFHALEHDLWWLNENSEFTFEEIDGTMISLNVGELQEELASINGIVLAFVENYVKNFNGTEYESIRHTYPHLFH